jgi:hypothetical protein
MELRGFGAPEGNHDRGIVEESLLPDCWGIAKVLDVVFVLKGKLPPF